MYILFGILFGLLGIFCAVWMLIKIFDDKEYINGALIAVIMCTSFSVCLFCFDKQDEKASMERITAAKALVEKEPKLKPLYDYFMADNMLYRDELEKLKDYYLIYTIKLPSLNKCNCK